MGFLFFFSEKLQTRRRRRCTYNDNNIHFKITVYRKILLLYISAIGIKYY